MRAQPPVVADGGLPELVRKVLSYALTRVEGEAASQPCAGALEGAAAGGPFLAYISLLTLQWSR